MTSDTMEAVLRVAVHTGDSGAEVTGDCTAQVINITKYCGAQVVVGRRCP